MLIRGRLVERGWLGKVHVAAGMNVLFYADGSRRFEHVCDRRPGGRGVYVVAPLLGEGHRLVTLEPLTINPSIVCVDCGLHGFVLGGRWVPV